LKSASKTEPVSFRRIVLATDGSRSAKRATQVAVELAKRYRAELIAINAIPAPSGLVASPSARFEGADVLDRYYEMARTRAKNIVEEAVALAKESGVQARGEVLDQPASAIELIISFAEGEGVDLIVSGTRGLSGFKKLLVGSVSSGLVSHAPCSVLIVR